MSAGVGQVSSCGAALINEACMSCATHLLSELVGPACMQARSSNLRGRTCRPNGKGSGGEDIE